MDYAHLNMWVGHPDGPWRSVGGPVRMPNATGVRGFRESALPLLPGGVSRNAAAFLLRGIGPSGPAILVPSTGTGENATNANAQCTGLDACLPLPFAYSRFQSHRRYPSRTMRWDLYGGRSLDQRHGHLAGIRFGVRADSACEAGGSGFLLDELRIPVLSGWGLSCNKHN